MTPSEEPNGFPDGFREGLDRWGSNLDRWPPTAANAARARLSRDPQARRWLAAAKSLDEHLRTFEQDTAPAGLAARIVARAADDRPVGQRVGQRVDKRVRQRPSRPASTQ